jgi:hypothetical protein
MSFAYVKNIFLVVICLFILFREGTCAFACSLLAATGDRLKDGGTLVAMTWDVPRNIKGELRLVIPRKGSPYLGLFPLQAKNEGNIVAGLNEPGLVLITASVDSKPSKKGFLRRCSLVETILRSFGTVDAVIANTNLISNAPPLFLIIADKSKIALIQIGSRGRYTVDCIENGLLYQTNHYTHQNLLRENEIYVENSILRYNRLQNLLANQPTHFKVEDFLSLADDRGNGPDNSIWRSGSSEKKDRTLARWVVYLSKNSVPELYFRLLNPGNNELNYEIKTDNAFWTEGIE